MAYIQGCSYCGESVCDSTRCTDCTNAVAELNRRIRRVTTKAVLELSRSAKQRRTTAQHEQQAEQWREHRNAPLSHFKIGGIGRQTVTR